MGISEELMFAAPHQASFDAAWTDADGASLLPDHLTKQRPARAWERRPHSPHTQRPGKIWRRVRMPGQTQSGRTDTDTVSAPSILSGTQSPKKVVKKLCLNTPFGQDWRTTEYERTKQTQTRKLATRPPIVLRSGTVIVPSDSFKDAAQESEGHQEQIEVLEEEDAQNSEWEDVDSDSGDDSEVQDTDISYEPSDSFMTEDNAPCNNMMADRVNTRSQSPSRAPLSTKRLSPAKFPIKAYTESPKHLSQANSPSKAPAESPRQSPPARSSARSPKRSSPTKSPRHSPAKSFPLQHPNTNESPVKSSSKSLPHSPSPSLRVESPSRRKSQPREQVLLTSPEKHASDKPSSPVKLPSKKEVQPISCPSPIERPASAPLEQTAQMETRSRPRVSDDTAILHAFLSKAAANKKHTATRQSLSNRRDSGMIRHALASPAKAEILAELDANSPSPRKSTQFATATQSPEPQLPRANELRDLPMRRSARKAKPLVEADPDIFKGPSKITIRGPNESLALKKTEVQELAAQTKANTKKNKAGAFMPQQRLSKLATEANGPEKDVAKVQAGSKTVTWDQTLAYYSDSPPVTDAVDERLPATEDAPLSPAKARSRRGKTMKPAQSEPAAEPVDAPAAIPKRRSRIATPAKGLLGKGSLLPKMTPQSGIPSIASFAPKIGVGSEIPRLSFEDAVSSGAGKKGKVRDGDEGDSVPRLASPAKRRPKAGGFGGAGAGTGARILFEAPGLSSQAKKRTRSVL